MSIEDNMEKIKEDAGKFVAQYWKCETIYACKKCPSKINGKLPYKYYKTLSCHEAMILHLIDRIVEVMKGSVERTCRTEEAYGTIGNGCVLDNCKLPRCSACHYPTRFEAHGFKYCPNCRSKVMR